MPVITACPDCGRKLRAPDEFAGKKVRCPGCQSVFVVSGDPEAAPETAPAMEGIETEPRSRRPSPPPPTEEDRERQYEEEPSFQEEPLLGRRLHEDDEYGDENAPVQRGNRAAWQKVASGLNFVIASIAILIGSYFVMLMGFLAIGMMAANFSQVAGPGTTVLAAPGARTGFVILMLGAILMQAVTYGVKVYGHYLGMSVPAGSGTRLKSLAVATFGLFAVMAGMWLSAAGIGFVTSPGTGFSMNPLSSLGGGFGTIATIVSAGLNLIGSLCYLAGFIVFILYLRGVARAVRRKDLANNAKYYLIIVIVAVIVAVVLGGMAVAALGFAAVTGSGPGGQPGAGATGAAIGGGLLFLGLTCLGSVGSLALFIWYIVLLFRMRSAVLDFARRGL
jgi:hypothetical protein